MQFTLGQLVSLKLSLERGVVIGRAEYLEDGPSYLVRYVAGDGRQVESWWNAGALEATPSDAELESSM